MPKPQQLCVHYRLNGQRCMAVALRGASYCQFHSRDRRRAAAITRAASVRKAAQFRALALEREERRRSATLLYALQINRALSRIDSRQRDTSSLQQAPPASPGSTPENVGTTSARAGHRQSETTLGFAEAGFK